MSLTFSELCRGMSSTVLTDRFSTTGGCGLFDGCKYEANAKGAGTAFKSTNLSMNCARGFGSPGQSVVTVRLQPPLTLPVTAPLSSTEYRAQLPFGSVPLKIEKLDPPRGVGAGSGKLSTAP